MEILPQSTNIGSIYVSEHQAYTRRKPLPPIKDHETVSPGSVPHFEDANAMSAASAQSSPKPSNAAAAEASLWTILKDVATFIFQIVAVIAALVFGAWAIKSYNVQLTANDLANQSLQYSATGNQYAIQALQDSESSNQNASQLAVLSGQLSLLAYCDQSGVCLIC